MSETKNIYLFIYFEESGINTQVRDPIFAMTLWVMAGLKDFGKSISKL